MDHDAASPAGAPAAIRVLALASGVALGSLAAIAWTRQPAGQDWPWWQAYRPLVAGVTLLGAVAVGLAPLARPGGRFATWRDRTPWVGPLLLVGLLAGSLAILFGVPRGVPGGILTLQVLALAGLLLASGLAMVAGLDGPSLRRRMSTSLGGLVGAVAVLLVLEIGVRVVCYRPHNLLGTRREIVYLDALPDRSAGPAGDLAPADAAWIVWDLRPYTVTVRASGLRGRDEVDPKSHRVLALGDSFTFGPYVADEDTWPAALESELARARRARTIQVINGGVAGYTIRQELDYLREKGLGLDPHVVVLAFTTNDLADLAEARQAAYARPSQSQPHLWMWILNRSAALDVARRFMRGILLGRAAGRLAETMPAGAPRTGDDPAAAIPTPRSTMAPDALADPDVERYGAEYTRHLDEMTVLLERRGVPLAIVAFPSASQVWSARSGPVQPQAWLEDQARRRRIPFLDLLPAFRAHAVEDLYLLRPDPATPAGYVGNGHLSRFGYRVAARVMAGWLRSLGMPRVAAVP